MRELKIGDVYHFNWSSKERSKEGYPGSLNHCFEGLLVVMEYPKWKSEKDKYENEIMLVDTYWGINNTNNKAFTLEEAERRGTLELYCNLNEIEKVGYYERDEYDDKDLFTLHEQHACVQSCIYYFKKKGAKKSVKKKISCLKKEIQSDKDEIEYRKRNIENLSNQIKKLKENGFN